MKRGGPLPRRTPLNTRKGLARTGMRRQPTARLVASRRIYADARQAVFQRDHGRCCLCGSTATLQVHHRIPRGMGGSSRNEQIHRLSAVVLLCADDHRLVESRREWARQHGYLLNRCDNSESVPILTVLRGWLVLDDCGGWTAVADPTSPVGRPSGES